MTKTLYVTGKMYEANTVSITDDELISLLTAEQSDGEFWENLEELHDRLMGDSVMNGFRVSEGVARFKASVDDDEISLSDLDFNQPMAPLGEPKRFTSNTLVFEKWSERGCLSCSLESEFDREKLDLSATKYTLPSGEYRYVVEPYYEDHDFVFGDSWTEDSRTYIVMKDGYVIDLNRA